MKERNAVINIRASKKDVALFDRAAEVQGKTRSEIIREGAMLEARRILRELPCQFCGRGGSGG